MLLACPEAIGGESSKTGVGRQSKYKAKVSWCFVAKLKMATKEQKATKEIQNILQEKLKPAILLQTVGCRMSTLFAYETCMDRRLCCDILHPDHLQERPLSYPTKLRSSRSEVSAASGDLSEQAWTNSGGAQAGWTWRGVRSVGFRQCHVSPTGWRAGTVRCASRLVSAVQTSIVGNFLGAIAKH